MTDSEIIEKISEIHSEYKTTYYKILSRDENSEIMEFINNWSELLEGKKLSTKIFWILNDIHEFPKCKTCGRPLDRDADIDLKNNTYHTYCSNRCATSSEDRASKIRSTNLERYGSTTPSGNPDVVKKMTETNLKRYGCSCALANDEIKSKSRNTTLSRYGTEYYSQTETYKKRIKETSMRKYGVCNPGCSKEALEKIRNTNLERRGVACSFLDPEVRERSRRTSMERYGVPYFLGLFRSNKPPEHALRDSYAKMMSNPYDVPTFTEDEYLNRTKGDNYHILSFKCLECGQTFEAYHKNGIHMKCPHCYPNGKSVGEKELVDFIASIYEGRIIHGVGGQTVIPPYELDAYLPDAKIAFEFDGIYWHSDAKGKDSSYHLTKTDMCNGIGIQLIHVFEDEWIEKQDIVKSRIRNLLGSYDTTIYARKCNVVELDSKTANRFIDENHIQGKCGSSVRLGLEFNGDIVSVMTFGRSRFTRTCEWELLRFCNKLGHHVVGGAGKLLKFFERNFRPTSIVSYADRRWSVGNLYRRLGFTEDHISKPDYWYVKNGARFSRIAFQKHKLKDKLKIFDESKSEYENMKMNSYHRLWDCGNYVFIKRYV